MIGAFMKKVAVPAAVAALLPALWLSTVANATGEIPWKDIRSACLAYLDAKATSEEMEKMNKALASRVETRVTDMRISEDEAMRGIMLDWAFDHQDALERKEPKAMKQACFYFVKFIDKGFQLPNQMRERLTPKSAQDLIAYLNKESAAEKG